MGWFGNIAAGLRALVGRARVEREMDEELSGFLEASAENKRHAGMTPEQAALEARVEMGSTNAVKHQVWSSRWESTLEGLLQDTRVSVRMLAKSPAFAVIALLSLALGIGGNTAIFTLINQVMLRNLPVQHPEQLVTFGDAENSGIAGGIDIGAYGLFPWYFARQLQADPGPFQGIASYGSFANEASVRLPSPDGVAASNAAAILVWTRLALGSSRARIIRQSLIETFLLSLAGGLLGLAVAFAATRALIAFVSQGNTYIAMSPTPDAAVLLFTLGVSLLTGLLFGLAPAIISSRIGASGNLSAGSRTAQSSGGKSARLWPKALVTAQVMLSLLLLVGAGLFLRSLRNLETQDYGFDRSHLLLAEFNAGLAGYKPSQTPGLYQQLLERLSALPGVKSVALAATPPISGGHWSSDITIPGYTPAPKENRNSKLNRVSGQYFETAGIKIVAGRAINDNDTANRQKVAVIDQTVARKFFRKGDAIGRSLKIDIDDVKGPWQIVGIARDTIAGAPRNTDPLRMIYIPLAQIDPFDPVDPLSPATIMPAAPEENQDRVANVILLRTTGDPANTIADLRAVVTSIDPNLPLTKITTIRDQVDDFISHDQLVSTLTTLFALLALLLAAIGLYGMMSYNVVRRTNEIGIRIALGAKTSTVQWMVLSESLLLLALGVGLGLPLAFAGTKYIKDQLFGLSPLDPMTFGVTLLIVSAMTLLAAWLPARRATKVDPMVALRCD